jgi:hypothetical protein
MMMKPNNFNNPDEWAAWSMTDAAKNLIRREELAVLIKIELTRSDIAKARGQLKTASTHLDKAEEFLDESTWLAKYPWRLRED